MSSRAAEAEMAGQPGFLWSVGSIRGAERGGWSTRVAVSAGGLRGIPLAADRGATARPAHKGGRPTYPASIPSRWPLTDAYPGAAVSGLSRRS